MLNEEKLNEMDAMLQHSSQESLKCLAQKIRVTKSAQTLETDIIFKAAVVQKCHECLQNNREHFQQLLQSG
jgi:hypothetical protein